MRKNLNSNIYTLKNSRHATENSIENHSGLNWYELEFDFPSGRKRFAAILSRKLIDQPTLEKTMSSKGNVISNIEHFANFSLASLLQRRNFDVLYIESGIHSAIGLNTLSAGRPPFLMMLSQEKLQEDVDFQKAALNLEKRVRSTIVDESEDVPEISYVRSGRKVIKIELKKLCLVEAMKDYLKLRFECGKTVVVKKTMTLMEEQLSPYGFIRVHRSFMVAKDHIKSMTKNTLTVGSYSVPIGRNYRQLVKRAISSNTK